jgi:hypothetical protein
VALFASLIEHPIIILVQAGRVLGLSLSLGFTLHLNKLRNHNLVHFNLGQSIIYLYGLCLSYFANTLLLHSHASFTLSILWV